jgi:hypothetical protein
MALHRRHGKQWERWKEQQSDTRRMAFSPAGPLIGDLVDDESLAALLTMRAVLTMRALLTMRQVKGLQIARTTIKSIRPRTSLMRINSRRPEEAGKKTTGKR